ncbi:MAG: PASTA domain-containing protein, partial [Muribaculaceae bacterium]|nr:PASTA domain-containing protein [Muribaculaceae bacterium]
MKFSINDFRRNHPILFHLVLICIVGAALLWGTLIFLDHWTMHGSTAVVPQIKHKSYSEARAILAANKLAIEISDSIYDRNLAPGTVVESWPKAGAVVKDGRQVYVTVTAFAPKNVTISMPLTGNVSSRQAMSYL